MLWPSLPTLPVVTSSVSFLVVVSVPFSSVVIVSISPSFCSFSRFPMFSWLSVLPRFSVLSSFALRSRLSWLSMFPWLSVFSLLGFWFDVLSIESEQFGVQIVSQTDFIVELATSSLLLSFLLFSNLLVLFRLENSQLFLLDPIGLHLSLLDFLSLGSSQSIHFDAFAFVILIESDGLWLWLFLLGLNSLSFGCFFSFLDVLFFIDFVIQVSDSSSSSTFLSGSVDSASATSSVEVMAGGGNFLGRNDFVVPFLSGILFVFFWEFIVGKGWLFGSVFGLSNFGLLDLLSLLMG